MNDTATAEATAPQDWQNLPPGDYCIVELFGHTTMVGRMAEVERFGSKMMALEPIFNGVLLPAIFHGGAAIYRLTPCSAKVAWENQPRAKYQVPATLRATLPPELIPAPVPPQPYHFDHDPDEEDDDDKPF